VQVDVSSEGEVMQFAAFVSQLSGGHVDVLVNNAATFVFESAEEVTEAGEPCSHELLGCTLLIDFMSGHRFNMCLQIDSLFSLIFLLHPPPPLPVIRCNFW